GPVVLVDEAARPCDEACGGEFGAAERRGELHDRVDLCGEGVERRDGWGYALHEGAVATLGVCAAVEVVDGHPFEEGHGPAARLLRRPVVDAELAAAASDVDAAVAED